MLAPQDPPTNATPPGSSTNTPLSSQSISRAPQVTNQFDDSSRASSIIAASPQYTDGYSVPPTHASDSPYRSPSNARHPHVQPSEYSPSVNHPQAYSPALSSNYVPPPSPTPSQPPVYPVSEGYNSYAKHDNAFQQQHRQHQPSHQTDPYQQTYQHQPYPKPITQVYPEPQFVDTPEKVNHQPVAQPKRRKKIIWIGAVVIVILIGVIIGLVVVMKNKTSDDNSNNNNSISGNSSTRTPTPTSAAFRPTATVTSTPINSTPVTFPTPIPVTVPSPGSSSGGGRVQAPGLPEPFPAPGRCDDFLCHNYFHKTCTGACSQDAEYKTCAAPCDALQSGNFCRADCERKNQCYLDCRSNLSTCQNRCRA